MEGIGGGGKRAAAAARDESLEEIWSHDAAASGLVAFMNRGLASCSPLFVLFWTAPRVS